MVDARDAAVADNSDSDQPREAIIYLGPLRFSEQSPYSLTGVARRLTTACEAQSRSGESTWRVEWQEGVVEKDETKATVDLAATIYRKDGDVEVPIFDLFDYTWADYLRESWERQTSRSRLVRLLFTVRGIPTFIRMFRSNSAQRVTRARMQLALAILVAVVMVFYAALVVWAAVEAIVQGFSILQGEEATISWPQWLVLIATALGLSLDKEKDRVANLGGGLAAAHTYVRGTTDQANQLRAPLQARLEELRADDKYTSVTLIAYSFGSVVAIDNLFPPAGPPARSYEKVTKLVTIGSAYDFVMAANRRYFEGRHARAGVPTQWINIYSPIDLLGSDFRGLGRKGRKELTTVARVSDGVEVAPDTQFEYNTGIELTWSNVIEFYGFNAHRAYWGRDTDDDTNVFTWAVPQLYAESDGPLR